ncbi:unnamed protein product, partial [Musa acuminata subsp. burmannicoides]
MTPDVDLVRSSRSITSYVSTCCLCKYVQLLISDLSIPYVASAQTGSMKATHKDDPSSTQPSTTRTSRCLLVCVALHRLPKDEPQITE